MRDTRDLETRIAELFADRLQIEVPAADVDLFAAGIVDSLMFVKLLASLEEQFSIHVSFQELEIDDFRTLRQIAGFVAAKQAATGKSRRVSAAG
ncbi:MAG TPA: phosphopantetheine-binding protein [Gemmatimonadales bacterium]|nr:phosphopantetheine-binding protein [Gemmatimonadales bacterium]